MSDPRIAVYSMTHNRRELTRRSFDMLRRWAGIPFDHYVVDNGSTDGTNIELMDMYTKGRLKYLFCSEKNLGQNIGANHLLDKIFESDIEYDWIVRWDNDMIPRTRRFLKRLAVCADGFVANGIVPVLAPKITKLKFPPEPFAKGDDIGFEYEVVAILGGQCRFHHVSFFENWRFNPFGALGFGEANEVADRCFDNNIPKLKIPSIEVEHFKGEDAQIEDMPEYFNFVEREVGRYVGYGL